MFFRAMTHRCDNSLDPLDPTTSEAPSQFELGRIFLTNFIITTKKSRLITY